MAAEVWANRDINSWDMVLSSRVAHDYSPCEAAFDDFLSYRHRSSTSSRCRLPV